MFEIVRDVLPPETNDDIINYLLKENWKFSFDNVEDMNNFRNNKNAGIYLLSYSLEKNLNFDLNPILNTYGKIIYQNVIYKSQLNKFKDITLMRLYWNYYSPGCITFPHKDKLSGNYFSILYNLNTNDGGTLIEDKFYKSNESEAIIFDSKLLHQGIAPINSFHRFNLNIIIHING